MFLAAVWLILTYIQVLSHLSIVVLFVQVRYGQVRTFLTTTTYLPIFVVTKRWILLIRMYLTNHTFYMQALNPMYEFQINNRKSLPTSLLAFAFSE